MTGGRDLLRLLAFPLLVVAAMSVLVMADLNGSSVAELAPAASGQSSVVAGQPRAIRTDEYTITTPLSVGETRSGFPDTPYVGMTRTPLAATAYGGPVGGWTEVFRPQDWGFFAFGPSTGLAFHWWFGIAISLIGIYFLTWKLCGSHAIAIALACVGTFTPYVAWWSCVPAQFVGFGAGAAACFIGAIRASRWLTAMLLASGCAYLAVGFFLGLYLPWMISIGWVLVALILGQCIDIRASLARVVASTALVVAVATVVVVVWYAQNRAAIRAFAQTIYPGQRVSAGGGTPLPFMLDAPASFWLSSPTSAVDQPANESELASPWLPLPLLVGMTLVALFIVWRPARPSGAAARTHSVRWSLTLTTVAAAVLTAWALLPLPSSVGKWLLLDRAESRRVSLAIGLAAVVIIALAAAALKGRRIQIPALAVLIATGAVAVVMSVWASASLPWVRGGPEGWAVAVSALALILPMILLLGGGRLGLVAAGVLVAYCFASWAVVNPLNRGLGPLADDPLVMATQRTLAEDPDAVTTAFGSWKITALLQGAGAQPRSFVTFYPNWELMTRIAPGQEAEWNNYVNWIWVALPEGAPTRIVPVYSTSKELRIDPCGPDMRLTGVNWIVSDKLLSHRCLRRVDVIRRGDESVFRYRVRGR